MINVIWPRELDERLLDRALLKLGYLPGYCAICGALTVFRINNSNFRNHVECMYCRSMNRQRQIILVLLSLIRKGKGSLLYSLKDIPREKIIWNLEVTMAMHEKLSSHLEGNYISSEYLSASLKSGEKRNNILHVDVQETHFKDNSLDFIISGDVMEHIPKPEKALKEIYRVLKPGGSHIFTAPFFLHCFNNEKRVIVEKNGEERPLLPPAYHEGSFGSRVLVYNIFGPEFLCQMEEAGFEPRIFMVYSVLYGILGNNGIVLVARKPES